MSLLYSKPSSVKPLQAATSVKKPSTMQARTNSANKPPSAQARNSPYRPSNSTWSMGGQSLQDLMRASIARNPQATFGPSPFVNYMASTPPPLPPDPTGAPTSAAGKKEYDYSHDPVLQSFDRLADTSVEKRRNLDLEAQKRILLGFGSRELAESVLGSTDPFLDKISADPNTGTSALAQLGYMFNLNKKDTIENFNKQNLFYGGHHALAQERLAREKLLQEATLAGSTREQLASITAAFEQFMNEIRMGRVGQEQAAYQRAIEAALRAGGDTASESTSTPPPTAPVVPPAQLPPAVGPAQQTSAQTGLSPNDPYYGSGMGDLQQEMAQVLKTPSQVAPAPPTVLPPANPGVSSAAALMMQPIVPSATPAANMAAQTAANATPGPDKGLAARSAGMNALYGVGAPAPKSVAAPTAPAAAVPAPTPAPAPAAPAAPPQPDLAAIEALRRLMALQRGGVGGKTYAM